MKNDALKTSVTIRDYVWDADGYGNTLTIPAGSFVTNQTALGCDDRYMFWKDFRRPVEDHTGFKDSMLHHHLTYYGLNIPAEFCEPYDEEDCPF